MFWNICCAVAGGWFFALACRALSVIRAMPRLKDVPVKKERGAWPRISLIVPASNEAATIGEAARSLLRTGYPNLELIFINDRSSDSTGEVLAQVTQNDPRAKVVTIRELPQGWLGKVHALHQGAAMASGEWLLFTDADVHLGPETLKKAVTFCENNQKDFLAAGPHFICKTFGLKIFVGQFLNFILLTYFPSRLDNPKCPDAPGAGAFNFVRRRPFDQAGGFTGIQLEVIDDAGLAFMVKRAGGKLDFISGRDEVVVEWYPDFRGIVKGMEKNAFALFQYSLPAVLSYVLGIWFITAATLLPPFFADLPFVLFFAAGLMVFLIASAVTFRKVLALPAWAALFLPLTFPTLPLLLLRSALITMKQGGIVWRNTFYPLKELRQAQRLRVIDFLFKKSES